MQPNKNTTLLTCGLVLLSVAIIAGYWFKNKNAADLDPYWNKLSAQSDVKIDHQLWQQSLDDYLVDDGLGVNLFDYEGLQYDGLPQLDAYIESLTNTDPHLLNRNEQMSYWINLYNALTVQLIAEAYPVESIMQLGDSTTSPGPWNDPLVTVNDRLLTLNNIEHNILRPIFNDHRIHFVVNCASIGCPSLASRAYSGEQLDDMLEQAAVTFMADARAVKFEQGAVTLSSLFDWYQADFGDNKKQVLTTLSDYLEGEKADMLKNFNGDIDYYYDWSLNGL